MQEEISTKKSIWPPIIIIAVIVLVVGGVGWWYFQNDESITPLITPQGASEEKDIAAALAYQQGDVQVKVGDGDWQAVETDTVLHQGDSVKTSVDSKAIIELENGDIFRLGFDTEVFLTSLTSTSLTISQVNGATYHRVSKDNSKLYQVKAEDITVQSVGTAFDVVMTSEAVEAACLESEINVITGEDEKKVKEGKQIKYNKGEKDITLNDINKENLTNNWYTWNKEEDSKKTDKLGVMEDYAGPELIITNPADKVTTVDSSTVMVEGTVDDFEAKLFINDEEADNNAGQFSKEITLSSGKNVITVVAEDSDGHRTIQEVKVIYQVAASATPIALTAETQDDGVHLSWNVSTNATFQYYKVVRSETNAGLKYPDDSYIAVKNKGEESHTDTEVSADKTYYYRVCEVMSGDKIFCSNVAHMQGKKQQQQEQNQEQNQERIGITLSASAENDGIHLSWTATDMTIEHGFKVVKGEAVNPTFPGSDYRYLSNSSTKSYNWAITDGNTYHFRVCQYNGDGKCLVYSNDVEITAKELTSEDIGLIMSAKAEDSGVGLWWTDVADSITGFKYYKVVRSKTNADPKYPDDSYIAVKSSGQESHRDYSAAKGTRYYYRICAVGNTIYCSNVIQVTAVHDNPAPSAVTLSGTYSGGSITLDWTTSSESDFGYYKVVWSQTNATPEYPADGYLTPVSKASTVTHTDDGSVIGSRKTAVDLSTGTHYYSVCVADSQSQIACSNVITLVDGVIQ